MLTIAPPHWTDEERALMTVGRWWSGWTRTRSMLAVVAALHLLAAFTAAFAPAEQLINVGTRPAFDLFPRAVWAVLFLLGGLGVLSLLSRFSGTRQVLTWLFVVPAQTMWAGSTVLAVLHGGGSAMAVAFMPAIVAFTAVTAVATALDYASGRR